MILLICVVNSSLSWSGRLWNVFNFSLFSDYLSVQQDF